MSLTTEPEPPAPYRILALDGGGVHALSYLPILVEFEKLLGGSIRSTRAFDMIVGTSTGAIVATAICSGMKATEISENYRAIATDVFERKGKRHFLRRLLFDKYSSEPLRNSLETAFGSRYGVAEKATWSDCARHLKGEIELVVTLWNVTFGKPMFLSTRLDCNHPQDKFLENAELSAIITACCSAPTYFPPRRFEDTAPPKRIVDCSDGGITGLNNPAVLGVSLAFERELQKRRRFQVLSLGAGTPSAKEDVGKLDRAWKLDVVRHLINAMFYSSSSLMRDFFRIFGGALGVELYVRTEPERTADEELDRATAEQLAAVELKLWKNQIKYDCLKSRLNVGDSTSYTGGMEQLKVSAELSEKDIQSIFHAFWPSYGKPTCANT